MSNVVDFKKYKDKVIYDPMIANDPFMRLTFANIIETYNLPYDTESVKHLQEDILDFKNPDGIVGIEEIVGLSVIFDAEQRQEIINHINTNYIDKLTNTEEKDEEISKAGTVVGYIILIFLLVAMIIGLVDIWRIIYNVFHSMRML